MKGRNDLILCPAAVQQAIEYWLRETQYQEDAMPNIRGVVVDNRVSGTWVLKVEFTDEEAS